MQYEQNRTESKMWGILNTQKSKSFGFEVICDYRLVKMHLKFSNKNNEHLKGINCFLSNVFCQKTNLLTCITKWKLALGKVKDVI